MNNQVRTYEITIGKVYNGDVECKNPVIQVAGHEDIAVNCVDFECGIYRIQVGPNDDDPCLTFIVQCEECDVCPPVIIEKCLCDTIDDCDPCEICVDGFCIPLCPEELCVDGKCVECIDDKDCECNQVCVNGECQCPIGTTLNEETGCCDECVSDEDCPACETCEIRNGYAVCEPIECPDGVCDQTGKCGPKGECVECLSSGNCTGVNECCTDDCKCDCCPGFVKRDGVCVEVDCTFDTDCGLCEICNSEGNCEKIKCPSGKVLSGVNGICCVEECDCFNPDCSKITDYCTPSLIEPDRCGCIPCEGDCDEGCIDPCYCNEIRDQCEDNPCPPDPCTNGAECGEGCGCLDGICVPCNSLPCLPIDECTEALGCECFGNRCEKSGCPPTPCATAFDCPLGCTCYLGVCVSCANFSCDNTDCDVQPGCACVGGECVGQREDCEDEVTLEKDDSNCDLIGRLRKDNCCACPQMTLNARGKVTAIGESAYTMDFVAEVRKGAFGGSDISSVPLVDEFSNPNIAENEPPTTGTVSFQIGTIWETFVYVNGQPKSQGQATIYHSETASYTGGTSTVTFSGQTIPTPGYREIQIPNVQYREVISNVITFTLSNNMNFPNDCVFFGGSQFARYDIGTVADFNTFNTSEFSNGKGSVITSNSCRKAFFKWTKDDGSPITNPPFRKIYVSGVPDGDKILYEDILTMPPDLESCKYYRFDPDCNCLGDQTKYIVFCNPADINYELSGCNRCITLSGPFEPCDVNEEEDYYVEFGDARFQWTGSNIPAGEELCSTTSFTVIKYGLVCDAQDECTKQYSVEAQDIEVTGQDLVAGCTGGNIDLTFTVDGGIAPYSWILYKDSCETGTIVSSGNTASGGVNPVTIPVTVNVTSESTFCMMVTDANGCENSTTTTVDVDGDVPVQITTPATPPCSTATEIQLLLSWNSISTPFTLTVMRNGIQVVNQSGLTTQSASVSVPFADGDSYTAKVVDGNGCEFVGGPVTVSSVTCGECTINANISPICYDDIPEATSITGTVVGLSGNTITWEVYDAGNNLVDNGSSAVINASVSVVIENQQFRIVAYDETNKRCEKIVTVTEAGGCVQAGCPTCSSLSNPISTGLLDSLAISVSGPCGTGHNHTSGQVTLTANVTDGTNYKWYSASSGALLQDTGTSNTVDIVPTNSPTRVKLIIASSPACASTNMEAYVTINPVTNCANCTCENDSAAQDVTLTVTGGPDYSGFGCLPETCMSDITTISVVPSNAACSDLSASYWRRVLPSPIENVTVAGTTTLTITSADVTSANEIYLWEYHHESGVDSECYVPVFYGFKSLPDGQGDCAGAPVCRLTYAGIDADPESPCIGDDFGIDINFGGQNLPSSATVTLFETNAGGTNETQVGSPVNAAISGGTTGFAQFILSQSIEGDHYYKARVSITGCDTRDTSVLKVTIQGSGSQQCVTCATAPSGVDVQFVPPWPSNPLCLGDNFTFNAVFSGATDPVFKLERCADGICVDVTSDSNIGSQAQPTGQTTVTLTQNISVENTYFFFVEITSYKYNGVTYSGCGPTDRIYRSLVDCSCQPTSLSINTNSSYCEGEVINLSSTSITSGGYGPGTYTWGESTGAGTCPSITNPISNPSGYIMPSNDVYITAISSVEGCDPVCASTFVERKSVSSCSNCICRGGGDEMLTPNTSITNIQTAGGANLTAEPEFSFPYSSSEANDLAAALENYMERVYGGACLLNISVTASTTASGVYWTIIMDDFAEEPTNVRPQEVFTAGGSFTITSSSACTCIEPTISAGTATCITDGFKYTPQLSGTNVSISSCTADGGTYPCAISGNAVDVTGSPSGTVTMQLWATGDCGSDSLVDDVLVDVAGGLCCNPTTVTLGQFTCQDSSTKAYIPVSPSIPAGATCSIVGNSSNAVNGSCLLNVGNSRIEVSNLLAGGGDFTVQLDWTDPVCGADSVSSSITWNSTCCFSNCLFCSEGTTITNSGCGHEFNTGNNVDPTCNVYNPTSRFYVYEIDGPTDVDYPSVSGLPDDPANLPSGWTEVTSSLPYTSYGLYGNRFVEYTQADGCCDAWVPGNLQGGCRDASVGISLTTGPSAGVDMVVELTVNNGDFSNYTISSIDGNHNTITWTLSNIVTSGCTSTATATSNSSTFAATSVYISFTATQNNISCTDSDNDALCVGGACCGGIICPVGLVCNVSVCEAP